MFTKIWVRLWIRFFGVCFALLLFITGVFASSNVFVGKKDGRIVYLLTDKTVCEDSICIASLMFVDDDITENRAQGFMSNMVMDCQLKTFALGSLYPFTYKNGKTNLMKLNTSTKTRAVHAITPGTMGEKIYGLVCN